MSLSVSHAYIGARRAPRFLTVSLAREVGILLALSVMFPFMIHILPLPEDTRWGPRLLPMFYAPLLAAIWGRTSSALLIALLAPWVNRLLTGHPATATATVMMVELLGFVVALRLLLAQIGPRWFLAAPAYFAGKAIALLIVAIAPGLIAGRPALDWAAQSIVLALPGVAILVLINFLMLRAYPPSGDGDGPKAA